MPYGNLSVYRTHQKSMWTTSTPPLRSAEDRFGANRSLLGNVSFDTYSPSSEADGSCAQGEDCRLAVSENGGSPQKELGWGKWCSKQPWHPWIQGYPGYPVFRHSQSIRDFDQWHSSWLVPGEETIAAIAFRRWGVGPNTQRCYHDNDDRRLMSIIWYPWISYYITSMITILMVFLSDIALMVMIGDVRWSS